MFHSDVIEQFMSKPLQFDIEYFSIPHLSDPLDSFSISNQLSIGVGITVVASSFLHLQYLQEVIIYYF